jgi:hypothetical protein
MLQLLVRYSQKQLSLLLAITPSIIIIYVAFSWRNPYYPDRPKIILREKKRAKFTLTRGKERRAELFTKRPDTWRSEATMRSAL